MPGLHAGASKKEIVKVKDFTKKRGYCSPVLLSDSGGCMTLLSGEAVFEAGLEGKAKIPAVIVQTDGEADDLMFALQSSELNETLNAIAASAAIVRLIDSHNVTRKDIAEALGKSSTWLNRMESLCRKLNSEVQVLVAQGHISPRSAQEIARLPKDVQMKFAVSVSNNFLNKESVAYLVNRYLNDDTGTEERERIIKSPELALPIETKYRGKPGRDKSVSARLSLAIARCLDGNTYLANVLDNIDIGVVAVRISDIKALSESLMALHAKLLVIFPPGGNESGDSND
jgi:hypothetical protein